MFRSHWLAGLILATALTACSGFAASTEEPFETATANPSSIEVTNSTEAPTEITPGGVIVGTAEVGTAIAYPSTSIPLDQITPVTEVYPTQTPLPPLPGGGSPTELKYRVLEQYPDFFFCDPDYYPIAREDEMVLAKQRFPEIQANADEFNAILAHNNLTGVTNFSDDQMLLIYREHKRLNALYFELNGDRYHFELTSAKSEGDADSKRIVGEIDAQGNITVISEEQAFTACPICLAADTLIDTPSGAVAVQDIRLGMLVWTLNAAGERVAQPVLRVGKTVVPAHHQVVHMLLTDGRELWVSPGHPTADQRMVGALHPGDLLDGSTIRSIERVRYQGYATFDLLPAGETGYYWANGILIASTLAEPPDR